MSLNKDNTKRIWKVINDLLGKEKEAPPNSLLIQGELANDEISITTKFAEFYSSVGQNVQAQELVNFNNDLMKDEFVNDGGIGNEIEFQPCTGDEILSTRINLENNAMEI